MSLPLTRYAVEQWIKNVATGEFHYKQVLEGQFKDKSVYPKLRKIMYDICHADQPICESIGRKDGYYRAIEDLPAPVDWQGADATQDFPVVLPFGLRDYVWIDKDTSIIVAGSKDSGKTGFLMGVVVLNMNIMNTVFLSNMEGGVNQIKRRFDAMDVEIPKPAPFKLYHITDNYHDAIKEPDTLYVIDYIDVPESGEFYMIAPALSKIQTKLNNSVAVIGLQKRRSSDIAFGGEQTLKKAGLYIAMNEGKLKIVAAKIPANPTVMPKNMQWTFAYQDEGTKFADIKPYYGD